MKIYIYNFQWKIDFLSIFYPIFPDLCHFIQLWKITQFFWKQCFGFGGRGELTPLPPAGAPALRVYLQNSSLVILNSFPYPGISGLPSAPRLLIFSLPLLGLLYNISWQHVSHFAMGRRHHVLQRFRAEQIQLPRGSDLVLHTYLATLPSRKSECTLVHISVSLTESIP